MIKNILISLFLFIDPAIDYDNRFYYSDYYEQQIERTSPVGLKESYKSSVVIFSALEEEIIGSGSGNYFRIKDKFFILTAAHVVTSGDSIFIGEKGGDVTEAFVKFVDIEKDIAILQPVNRLNFTKAVKFKKDKRLKIGKKIYHTGHPDGDMWHISEGILSSIYSDVIIANTFAWPGSSGSVVFNEKGHVVGVVSAIKISGPLGIPDMVEHIVSLGRLGSIDEKDISAYLN